MNALLNWISANPTMATIIIGVLLLIMVILFIVAFLQGREVSFYPPKIGELKMREKHNKKDLLANTSQSTKAAKESLKFSGKILNNCFEHSKGWAGYDAEMLGLIENANEVRILKIKGRDLYKELPLKMALANRAAVNKFTRILLQDPHSKFVTPDVAKEFIWPDYQAYIRDFFHSHQMHAESLPNYKNFVRLYDFLPLLKLYVFDDDIFVSAYLGKVDEKEKKGEVDVWRLSRSKNTFGIAELIVRFFDALWENSRSPALVKNKTVILNEENGSLLIPVRSSILNTASKKLFFRNTFFFPKDEHHITIIGPKLGDSILEKMRNGKKREQFMNVVAETNWDYELSNQYFHLVKSNGDLVDENGTRQSIIQLVKLPSLSTFYSKLEAIFDMSFPLHPSHITLYTTSVEKEGIGIYTEKDFDKYNFGEIDIDVLEDYG